MTNGQNDQDHDKSNDFPKELEQRIELEIRRRIDEQLKGHTDFLKSNTRWVVGGFFGVLTIFSGLLYFIFGSQLDTTVIQTAVKPVVDAEAKAAIELQARTLIKGHLDGEIENAKNTISDAIDKYSSEKISNTAASIRADAAGIAEDVVKNLVSVEIAKAVAKLQETKLDATDLLKLAIPPGAVLAFDRKDGCPAGWSDLGKDEPDRFAGRMLIAIGPRKDRPDNQTTLERAFDAQGGEERVTLTIPQMPRHFHRVGDHHSRLASSRFNSIQE